MKYFVIVISIAAILYFFFKGIYQDYKKSTQIKKQFMERWEKFEQWQNKEQSDKEVAK